MAKKRKVYFFGGKRADVKELENSGMNLKEIKSLLGGKGEGLSQMIKIGIPVPGGFTITTECCAAFYTSGKKWVAGLEKEVRANLKELEKVCKKKLGDDNDPLLISVRSGAAISMPGMMETILNLGLNDKSVEGLARKSNNRRFAFDAYRRFIMMYGSTAMGIEREAFDEAFDKIKETKTRVRLKVAKGTKVDDTEISESELEEVVAVFKAIYKKETKQNFPQEPWKQLVGAIDAVFGSWMAEKAITYRRVEKISDRDVIGTAVNVQQMVYGNMGNKSGTGVCFTRDPSNGKDEFYGDYLVDAQGEDVVAGVRTPLKLIALKKKNAKVYKQLCDVRSTLEKHYKDMMDLEFTVEDEKLYMLQCRAGKRTAAAAFKIAVDMVKEKIITKEEALLRVGEREIEGLFYPVIDPKMDKNELKKAYLASGIDAVPGAAAGKIALTAAKAEKMAAAGEIVILVRHETSPEDIGGMHAAKGILTQTGGKTSHAAVVARGWGKCCIVGAEEVVVDYKKNQVVIAGKVLKEGAWLTLNGSTGDIYNAKFELAVPEMTKDYKVIMKWADEVRRLKVRTNADTPADSLKAVELGAQGIGLCRTEHMFFGTEARLLAIQEMIIASTEEKRKAALAKLLPFQRDDFFGIFKAMKGKPVTIRLVDPPLHEFTPKTKDAVEKLSEATKVSTKEIWARSESLHEANPMLGHRGCRLSLTYPEIQDMQVTAIIQAAIQAVKKKIKVEPEIMIPLVMHVKELAILVERTHEIAQALIKKAKVKVDYKVGTMIEVPRAALTGAEIAKYAEFYSFGTNDLTQMTMGISRDDYGTFIGDYVDEKKLGVFDVDPFQALDQTGVGRLMEMCIEESRASRVAYAKANKLKKEDGYLKIGICGEHGGEPSSVKFCHKLGMDYVSCSPLRVPVARLAAAQVVIEEKMAAKAAKKAAPKKKVAKKTAKKKVAKKK